MHTPQHTPLLLLFLTATIAAAAAAVTESPAPLETLLLPSDAVSLLSFKSKADLDNKLLYTLNERFDYCQWQGVKCVQGRVVRFVLQGFGLRGHFAADTLTKVDQLRILSLRNNFLYGPIPDLSGLTNLKTLFLDHNYFSGTFPPSLLILHSLLNLDLSHNNLTGAIPAELTLLDRLSHLRLDSNRFNGSIPSLNQTTLVVFNVSNNNLSGPVPVTPTLKKFSISSFHSNPELCGDVVNRPCRASPFFDSPPAAASPPTLIQNARSQGDGADGSVILSPPAQKKHPKTGAILGFLIGALIFLAATLSIFALVKRRRQKIETKDDRKVITKSESTVNSTNIETAEPEIKEKKKIPSQAPDQPPPPRHHHQQQMPRQHPETKSGSLVFCSSESEMYTLEQLMRASAELLGRGTLGTTYKAVMDNQLIVSVKRLDACKASITSGEAFEEHMETVGVLRHPNLVPVRAYFQAKQERLIIFDYQPNGSLFNLIHGSRSTRAKPLHWTSCLKIAEDVAQGLAYIHQASRFVHGNLKSSNVLLGSDFEACLTDYGLTILADISPNDAPDCAGYIAPEIRKSLHRATSNSDVYAFGVLLLELLSGKPPSQHPFLAPPDVLDWVRVMREDNSEEDKPLGMLVEVATVCSMTSPEQRPTIRQVLKMIQDIKESAMVGNGVDDPCSGYS